MFHIDVTNCDVRLIANDNGEGMLNVMFYDLMTGKTDTILLSPHALPHVVAGLTLPDELDSDRKTYRVCMRVQERLLNVRFMP